MLVNNSVFALKNMAAAFQPAHNVAKMVSTINNNLAVRQDSFAKSAELEKQMRRMMLAQGHEAPVPKPVQKGDFALIAKNPVEARLDTIDIAARYLTRAKDWVSLIQKHEATLADESTSAEQRANSIKLNKELKNLFEGTLASSIEAHSAFSDGSGRGFDSKNQTDQFAKIVEKTGDLSAKGLGLTGFANMSSAEILEKLDGALAHLNEMGKLVNPAYTPPAIAPVPQKELDRFERTAERWDYITGMLVDGVPKPPMAKTTLSLYA